MKWLLGEEGYVQARDIRETVSRLVLGQLVDVTERPVSERVVIALGATGEEDALTDVSRSSTRDDVLCEHGSLLVLRLVLLEELVQVSDVLRSEDVSACDVVTDEVRHGLSVAGSSDNGKRSVLRGDVFVGASRVSFLHQAHLTLRFTLVGERVRPFAAVTVGLNNGELHDVSVLSYQSRKLEGCKSQRKRKAKTEGFYRRLPLCLIVARFCHVYQSFHLDGRSGATLDDELFHSQSCYHENRSDSDEDGSGSHQRLIRKVGGHDGKCEKDEAHQGQGNVADVLHEVVSFGGVALSVLASVRYVNKVQEGHRFGERTRAATC
jgi:hypothetical protein